MEKSTCLHGIYLLLSILLVTLFIGCDSNKKIEKGNIEGISQNIQNCEEVYPFKEGLALVCQMVNMDLSLKRENGNSLPI